MLNLTPDELLTTTRAVRRRLDLRRPVERKVIEECLAIAQQAPTASNRQHWHFVVVTDASKRKALGELFRRGGEVYLSRSAAASAGRTAATNQEAAARLRESASFLIQHIQDVPVHVIPCISGRPEGLPLNAQAAMWCSIVPATWSFMLAARARGLGTTFTSFHLSFEKEAAEILGIPFEKVTQTALIPVAYTKGGDFRPAARAPLATMVHWEAW
jgi:nitroreductase